MRSVWEPPTRRRRSACLLPESVRSTLPVSITIGGVPLAASDIYYVGVSPSYIGLYQVNLRVPDGIPSGNQSMVIQVGGTQSPTGGYLTIQ